MNTQSDCKAVLNIKGEHFACDAQMSHDIHGNTEAGAIWVSADEAQRLPDQVEA